MKLLARFGALLLIPVLIGVYLALGYYQLEPDEEAVVLRFGRPLGFSDFKKGFADVDSVGPGPHFRLLFIDSVERERVIVEREEFGFRTIDPNPPQQYEDRPDEKRMLTGDSNLVDLEFVVQWQISNIADYRFRADRVPELIRDAAQAAVREIIAQRPIDDIITKEKGPIAEEAKAVMQSILDRYGAGVDVLLVQLQEADPPDEVKDAFRDVISAEQDKERVILEARGYADQVVPVARGEAQALINEAEAYRETRILEARGEADRFNALLAEYRKAPEVTRERLYIETLEEILPGMEKIIVEEGHAERVLPYLPIGPRGRDR